MSELNLTTLSSVPVEGIAYKSNLSSFRGSVYGGPTYGVFDNFSTLINWMYEYNPVLGMITVWKEADPGKLYTVGTNLFNVKEISFTFDKQMLPVYTYIKDNKCYVYFFDSSSNDFVNLEIPEAITPKIALSSVHRSHSAKTQVVLGYVRDQRFLCVRLQQDRYSKEYVVKEFDNKIKLFNIGYTSANRFQYEILEVQA